MVVVGHQADEVRATRPTRRAFRASAPSSRRSSAAPGTRCAAPCRPSTASSGDVLILYGDVPLIRPATLRRLVETHRAAARATCRCSRCARRSRPATAGSCATPTAACGGIVEERDATPEERDDHRGQPRHLLRAAPRSCAPLLGRAARRQRAARVLPDGHRRPGGARRAAGDRARDASSRTRSPASTRERSWQRMETTLRARDRRALDGGGRHLRGSGDRVRRPRGRDRRRHRDRPERHAARPHAHRPRLPARRHGVAGATPTLGDGVHLRFGCWVERGARSATARHRPVRAPAPGHASSAERVHIGNFVETKKAALGRRHEGEPPHLPRRLRDRPRHQRRRRHHHLQLRRLREAPHDASARACRSAATRSSSRR